ncbi:hypothetical protein C823_003302 [Eubacterium plexicaudatum ASF492]|nr:hypothetical protein C823_003302 [Eubacterium plexicaudatum ASF492]
MTSEELAVRIRMHAVELTHRVHASHVASVLSIADIIAVLYKDIMYVYPDEPQHVERDRFVLSKGHAGLAVYAALAERDFFKIEKLETYYQDGTFYPDIFLIKMCRVWNFQRVLWDMAFRLQWGWRLRQKWMERGTVYMSQQVMGNVKRAVYGKQRFLRRIMNWTI